MDNKLTIIAYVRELVSLTDEEAEDFAASFKEIRVKNASSSFNLSSLPKAGTLC